MSCTLEIHTKHLRNSDVSSCAAGRLDKGEAQRLAATNHMRPQSGHEILSYLVTANLQIGVQVGLGGKQTIWLEHLSLFSGVIINWFSMVAC